MIWWLAGLAIFFALSSFMNALDDNIRGFFVHGAIAFVLFICFITYLFYRHYHP